MGTKIWGSTTTPNGGTYFLTPTNAAIKADNNAVGAAEDGYIDSIYVYCGSHNGGTGSFKFAIYGTGGHMLGSETPALGYGTGYGWNHGSYAAGSYLFLTSGTNFVGAVIASGQALQLKGYNDGGKFDWWDAGSATDLPSTWPGSPVTTVGNMGWYATYFPTATISSFSPTVGGAGTTVTLTGVSYSAGVTGVSFNGTAASSYSYINDTTVTAVVPTGATSGAITITTNAGNATSASAFTVAGAYVMRSGTWTPTQGVYVMRSSVWTQVTGVYVMRSGTWTPTG